MISISSENDKLIELYKEAKERLEVSLKLYRLVVFHNISSEIPAMQARMKCNQAVYERLYHQMHPDEDELRSGE